MSISNCTGLTTSATASANVGDAISDTATLTGATANATGTMTFKLYGPQSGNDPSTDTCVDSGAGANLVTTIVINSIGSPDPSGNYVVSSGDYDPATPLAVGRYQWRAFYSGNGSNAAASTACKDSGEVSVIAKANSSIATAQNLIPNDTASITPNSATGTVDFYLFAPGNTCSDANKANADFSATGVSVSSGSASTSNTTQDTDTIAGSHADAIGTWSWLVVYSGDNSTNGSSSDCVEAFTITEPTP